MRLVASLSSLHERGVSGGVAMRSSTEWTGGLLAQLCSLNFSIVKLNHHNNYSRHWNVLPAGTCEPHLSHGTCKPLRSVMITVVVERWYSGPRCVQHHRKGKKGQCTGTYGLNNISCKPVCCSWSGGGVYQPPDDRVGSWDPSGAWIESFSAASPGVG